MKLKCVRNSTIKTFKEISSTRFDQIIMLFPLHKGNHQNVEITSQLGKYGEKFKPAIDCPSSKKQLKLNQTETQSFSLKVIIL